MKTQKSPSKIEGPELPKYFLPDVPRHLRTRVLDLCIRRYWHDAMTLLEQHGFNDYTRDDLVNFYHWAPAELPSASVGRVTPCAPPEPSSVGRDSVEPPQPALVGRGVPAEPLPSAPSVEPPHSKRSNPPTHQSINPDPSPPPHLNDLRQSLVDLLSSKTQWTADGPRPQQPETTPAPTEAQPQPSPDNDPPSSLAHPPSILPSTNPLIHPSINPSALLTSLRDVITRYVVLPELAPETLALWVVHTYAFTLRQVTTYIGVVSPEKRCGKTTLLELLGLLANRSLTAANISPSALFRVIQDTKPTLLIDEADTFLQGRDELGGILNAGYRKGNAYVVRLGDGKPRRKHREGERPREPEFGQWTQDRADDFAQYSCWCPKVMAAIGRLPDTLADRCIVIAMQRKMPGEKCDRLRHLNATEYRKRCADFVREHSDAIALARPEIPSTLNDRAADIWEPLLAIADLAGGDWPELARRAAVKLSGSVDDEMTLIGYFLKDIRTLMLNSNAAAARSTNGGSAGR